MKLNLNILIFGLILILKGCVPEKSGIPSWMDENILFVSNQLNLAIQQIESNEYYKTPVTLKHDGTVYSCEYSDWRSGFFPGSLWYLYELTNDSTYLPIASKYTESLKEAQDITWNHDIGFIINCSFGNGYRITANEEYIAVMKRAAASLITRFHSNPGVLKSWNVDQGKYTDKGWECPVVIDNLMNLELLFNVFQLTGDSIYYNIAVSHAERTLQEQFRPDGSCYQVIDYDLLTGEVRNRHTAQGYAHESSWSRGQAWAIYGLTMCYRETGDRRYLDQAVKTFDYMARHPAMPGDLIPYWDMDAPDIPHEFRDVSSAACMASALYEMSTYNLSDKEYYKYYADQLLNYLSSPEYRAKPGENGNFLLMHSVGSVPHNVEIDVPLNYADYYFLEALKRKKELDALL